MRRPERDMGGYSRRQLEALRSLLVLGRPSSGRRVAEAMGVAPATAINALRSLEAEGVVESARSGRSTLWVAVETSKIVRDLAREDSDRRTGSSPSSIPIDADQWVSDRPNGSTSSSASRDSANRSLPVLRVVVLTALEVEYEAVRRLLDSPKVVRLRNGSRFERGVVETDQVKWEVFVAQIGMGNAGAAAAAMLSLTEWNPRLLMFVGVAGGLKPDDQAHGEIVVADRVYNVHSGKISPTDNGSSLYSTRPLSRGIPHRLEQLVLEVARVRNRRAPEVPRVHVKPIVAGEVVLADPKSDLRARIATNFNDAAAVDMESHGLYEAAHVYDDVPVLAVRGLSDLLGDKDAATDKKWQPIAAANAAEFAIELLRGADEGDLGGEPAVRPPEPSRGPASGSLTPFTADLLQQLPPTVRHWARCADSDGEETVRAAVEELAAHSKSPAGWLSRSRHRPPAWMREDRGGISWAMVASYADAFGHRASLAAWDEAARRADSAGLGLLASWERMARALSCVRIEASGEHASEEDESERLAEAKRRLHAESSGPLAPVATFLRDAVASDLGEAIDRANLIESAATALSSLGEDLQPLRLTIAQESLGESGVAEFAEAYPEIAALARYEVLLLLGNVLASEERITAALRCFESAEKAVPGSSGSLLLSARARLQRLDAATLPPAEATAELLARAEQEALLSRSRRRDWGGATGEALAMAGRARARAGDPARVLQFLLPKPDGTAEDSEARHPEVKKVAAYAALALGKAELVVELALGVADPIERDLLRGAGMSLLRDMNDEAERSYRRVAEAKDVRPDQLVRALLGLVRIGVPVGRDKPGTLADHVERLRREDPEAADLVMAHAALRDGKYREALGLARQYPKSAAAVQVAAQAAADDGRPEEAVLLLDKAGKERGDEALRVHAMQLAARSGRIELASPIAAVLAASTDLSVRRSALHVQLQLAEQEERWDDAADLSRLLINECEANDGQDDTDLTAAYRWANASALYNLRRPSSALRVLHEPDVLGPRTSNEALLILALLQAYRAETTGDDDDPLGIDPVVRALDVAAAWPDDEAIGAAAIGVILTAAPERPLPDDVLIRARTLQEDFFARFPDTQRIRRIQVDDNLDALVAELRESLEPVSGPLTDIVTGVWLARYPLAILQDVTPKTYSELLLTGSVGCLVIHDGDELGKEGVGRRAAESGIDGEGAVVDLSTLTLLRDIGLPAGRLTSQARRVVLAEPHRDDLLAARARLSLRSSGSLWWNHREGKPGMTEYPAELTETWERSARASAELLPLFDVVPAADTPPTSEVNGPDGSMSWDTSIRLAQRLGLPLWADDLALRRVATSLGVPAFSTLELVRLLVERQALSLADESAVLAAVTRLRAVDLPGARDRLLAWALDDGFRADGYAILALSRPVLWSPVPEGFNRYTALMRSLPQEVDAQTRTAWAHAAFVGASWASPPPARRRVVASILTWTLLEFGDPSLLPLLMEAGEDVMALSSPGSDLIPDVVAVLVDTLRGVVNEAEMGRTVTRLLSGLDVDRRRRAMTAFLTGGR